MNNRAKYLVSNVNGKMDSEYLRLKSKLKLKIANSELENDKLFNIDDPMESADPQVRKNQRSVYIKNVNAWLKAEKKLLKANAKKQDQSKKTSSGLDDQLLLDSSEVLSEVQASEVATDIVFAQIQDLENVLAKMEEARQAERFLEVYEIRINPDNRKVKLSSLPYNVSTGAYQFPEAVDEEEKGEIAPDFKIVTGGRRLKDKDDVVISVTQNEYNTLQELGATGNREKTLMAQLINDYGTYRRGILNTAVRFKAKTDTWAVKEKICQHIISRLRALQHIEAAYGAPVSVINEKMISYENSILALNEVVSSELATRLQINGENPSQEERWMIDVLKTQVNNLHKDIQRLNKLRTQKISEKTIAHWLLKQAEHVIEQGKLSAELVDISGKRGISKGQFSEVTANAFERARTFEFPPHRRLRPQNQGIFDEENEGHQLVISSSELASGERGTRDILFAFACVKSGLDLTNSEDFYTVMEQSLAATKLHRGFAKISASWNRSQKNKDIHQSLDESDVLNTSQAIWYTYYLLRDKVRATNESCFHAFAKVMSDAGKSVKDSAVGAVEEFADVTVQFAKNVERDFTYKNIPPSRFDVHIKQSEHPHDIAEEKLSEGNLVEQRIPGFQQWQPHTLYSVVDNFLLEFGGFFIKKYEASPFIWTMATLIGALAGATAVSGPAVKAFLMQCKCPEVVANGFVEVSQAISVATTNSQLFQVVGTGSTVQQGLFVVLDTLASGADSFTAQAAAEFKRNLPIALCVIAGSTFGGWALGHAEMFSAEFGTVPIIAEFFTGLKFAGFGYEALEHEPGEKSAVANTVASGLNATYNFARATMSFLQLFVAGTKLITCNREEAKVALQNGLRPWLDLTDTGTRLLWSTLDTSLRCTTTLSRGGKAVIKAALETPLNMVAKTAKIVGLSSVSKAIVKGKSAAALAFDDSVARPLHNVTRSVRRGYATLMTQDDMYLGASPLSIAHSSHSFYQVIKKKNQEAQQQSKTQITQQDAVNGLDLM